MSTIQVTLNYLGVPIDESFVDEILSDNKGISDHPNYRIVEGFFGLPLKHLPRDALIRYCEVSKKETYTGILPHEDKLFERILSPFKSAKRCYCLGEYIAAIELCAHVAEMLASLSWDVFPIEHNGVPVTKEFEKAMWGCEFEKLGQEKRIKILKAFGSIKEHHVPLFDALRTTRRKYFHLWSADISKARKDALDSFLKSSQLVKEILKVRISDDTPGKVVINPLLNKYLQDRES